MILSLPFFVLRKNFISQGVYLRLALVTYILLKILLKIWVERDIEYNAPLHPGIYLFRYITNPSFNFDS